MKNTKLGLVCVSLEGEKTDLARKFKKQAVKSLQKENVEVVNAQKDITLSRQEAIAQCREAEDAGADAIVFLIGTWILCDHVIDAARSISLPMGVWGIPEPISFSSVGANAVHGTMEELGIRHRLFYGETDDSEVTGEIAAFTRAASAYRQCRSARFGLIGGRAISAYTTAADPNQIKEVFGTEVEHIDQLILLEKARGIREEQVDELVALVKGRYGAVEADEEYVRKSVSLYAALKEIKEEYELDFFSVKCLGELMDTYTSCCLALAMLNDEGIVANCQCSVNAALSMYIMSKLTDDPPYFGDVNTVIKKEGVARLINCGSIPGRLAQSMEDVKIVNQYEYMGKGRGACTFFCCKEGDVTFGTLGRIHGRYVMSIAEGQAFQEPMEKLAEVRTWAQGFVRLNCDPMKFYENLRSNHCAACYGKCMPELIEFCRIAGIEYIEN